MKGGPNKLTKQPNLSNIINRIPVSELGKILDNFNDFINKGSNTGSLKDGWNAMWLGIEKENQVKDYIERQHSNDLSEIILNHSRKCKALYNEIKEMMEEEDA